MNKRGQISVEYILIIAVALMIILPGIYLFRNYVYESSDLLIERRLSEISNDIFTKAQKMYFYGPPSKSTLPIEMPPEINNMYILGIPSVREYYLVFRTITTEGEQEFIFQTDTPLYSDLSESEMYSCDISDNCNQGYCVCFDERFYSQGLKNFKIEASEDCFSSPTCIHIEEVSDELT